MKKFEIVEKIKIGREIEGRKRIDTLYFLIEQGTKNYAVKGVSEIKGEVIPNNGMNLTVTEKTIPEGVSKKLQALAKGMKPTKAFEKQMMIVEKKKEAKVLPAEPKVEKKPEVVKPTPKKES